MRRIVLSYLVVLSAMSGLYAQVPSLSPFNGVSPAVFNTAGGTYDNPASYYRFEWSFGELVLVQSMAPPDSSVFVSQGVLQPCTDMNTKTPVTVIFQAGDYKLFPNPTNGPFELDFFINTPGQMSLQLVDMTGRVLEKRSYHYNGCCRIELFDLSKHPNAVYYVLADLKPDTQQYPDQDVIRHSGLVVVKLDQK